MSRAALILRSASNRATRRIAIRWGEQLGMYPVVGFPKSGGTWLCRMLADAARLPFAQVPLLPVAMPCVVHGHWRHHPRLRNVTCTVRDGRDTMVSFYFYCRLQLEDTGSPRLRRMFKRLYGPGADLGDARANMPRFIEEMFERPIGTLMNWAEYNRAWLGRPGVAIVRYEALLADPARALAALMDQHGRTVPDWRIGWAVKGNDMRLVTGRDAGQADHRSFIRKGVSGDWRETFSREAMEIFADRGGEALVELGYERSASWREWSDGV